MKFTVDGFSKWTNPSSSTLTPGEWMSSGKAWQGLSDLAKSGPTDIWELVLQSGMRKCFVEVVIDSGYIDASMP